MARSPRRDDEDALDPVEAADQPVEGEDDDLDGFRDVDPDEDDDLDFDDEELPEDLDADLDDDLDDDIEDDIDTEAVGDNDLPDLLTDEEDLVAVVAAASEEDEEEDEDTLREGEFICSSCFMAKRDSALADAAAQLCRDCV